MTVLEYLPDLVALTGPRGSEAAGTLSLGTRYTHSPIEVLNRVDLEGAVEVLRRFVPALPTMDPRFTALEEA